MGRSRRNTLGGYVYHVLNRANGRLPIFGKDGDYEAFERILLEAFEHVSTMRLLDYCVMPNHWHLVLWPVDDGDLSDFVHWLTLTHSQRWKAHYHQVGCGHLYQGRFKSFPVQDDEHLLAVCRYVERNPLRAGLVERVEAWRWGSLWHRQEGSTRLAQKLTDWPVPRPSGWLDWVNEPLTEVELEAIRGCVNRGKPLGDPSWMKSTATRMGLESTMRTRGRPRKISEKGS